MSRIMSLSGFSLIWKLLLLAKCWRALGQDSGSPIIINCPNNFKIDVPSSIQSLRVFWEEPTAADSNGPITVTKSHTSGAIFPADQTTIVEYIFTNSGRQSSECQFEILLSRACDILMPCVDNGLCYNDIQSNSECIPVSFPYTLCNHSVDTTPPQCVDVPGDIHRVVELGNRGLAVIWTEPTCTDDSGKASIIGRSHSPATFFTTGETIVRYTCEDISGNMNTCSFVVVVTVEDTISPTISNCPDDVTLDIELGEAGSTVFWSEPTATDISGIAVLNTRTHVQGSFFPVGTTTVTYQFIDGSGNLAECTFAVVVLTVDTVPPTVSMCVPDIKQTIGIGESGAVVNWTEPTATDLSGVTNLVSKSHSPGESFPVGVTEVMYIFSDESGNTAACTFSVEISSVNTTFSSVCDKIPVDIVETVELGTNGTIITWTEPTCSDTLGNAAFLLFRSHSPPSFFTVGRTTVNYTCLSSSGNVAWCDFSVTVNAVDTTPPMCVNLPAGVSETVELGDLGTLVSWAELSCSDLSGTAEVTSRSHIPYSFFIVGSTDVIYICTDASGNTESCAFPVNVIPIDTTPPQCVNLPNEISRIVELGTPGIEISWIEPTCSDISGASISTRSHTPPSFFAVGMAVVSYTCTDISINSQTCSFPVTVSPVDTTPPECVNVPADITQTVEFGTPNAQVFYIEPACSDISGTASVITSTHTPPATFGVGETTVTYTCGDASGNTVTCSFTVAVTEAPLYCPDNIIVETDAGEGTANVFWKETFDNDTVWNTSGYVTASHTSGDDFLLGNTMVLYSFYDSDGIIIHSCQFCVTVVSGGMIVDCPRHAIVTPAKSMSTIVTWNNPVVFSDGSPRNLSSLTKVSPGDSFKVGVTRVTYKEDEDVCRFSIIVQDITPPEIVHCTHDILVQLLPGETSSEVNWVVPRARDHESEFLCVQSTHSPGDRFEAGLTTVSYTFSDNSGNEATCKFSVHVAQAEDTNPPNIVNCPESVLNYEFQEQEDDYELFWQTPTATDDLNLPITVSSSHSNRDRFPIGSTHVTYIFTDVVGNVATCRFEVYISVKNESQERPRFKQCPCDVVKTLPSSNDSIQVLWDDPTLVGSLRGIRVSQTHHSGDLFKRGRTEVVFTAHAVGEVIATCQFLVDVIDISPPDFINCPSSVRVRACRGLRTANWIEPYSMDNSGNEPDVIFQSHLPRRSLFKYGTTSVTYLFRDGSGNTIACNFTVNVHRNGCNFLTPVILIIFAVIIFIVLCIGFCCPCVIVPLILKNNKQDKNNRKDKNNTSTDTDGKNDQNSSGTNGAVADENIPLESLDMTADVHAQDNGSHGSAELA